MKNLHYSFLVVLLVLATFSKGHAQFGLPISIPGVPTGDVDPVKLAHGTGNLIKGLSGIGAKEEAGIGGAVAVAIVSTSGGVWKNEEATKRVATIGKALVRYSNRPNSTFVFGILNSEGINGVSAPGGYVFISKGLYEAVKDDDELAGVIAHEIAHVTCRHALQIISGSKITKGMVQVASGASGVGDVGGFDDMVAKGAQSILNVGFHPGKEFDADHDGRDIADAAGFRRDGLQQFLTRLYEAKKDESYAFSKHPPLKHRLDRLKK